MSRRRTTRICVTAAVALVCAGAPAAHAVQGGTPTGGVAAATVKIDVGGTRACSGALVSASWVVTAKSCFAGSGAVVAGAPTQPTTVTVGRTDLTSTAGRVVPADRVVPHADRDLVLVRLASPAEGVAPVALAAVPPATGETLTVAGYGRTSTQLVPDTAHTARFTVGAVAADTVGIQADEPGATICKGDAGGPTLRTTAGGAVELVAIHHTAYQGGCLGATTTLQGATETRVDNLRDWISLTISSGPLKLVYTVNGGQVHEASSQNGWTNLSSAVATSGALAVTSMNGVKYIYTVNGGQVYEAASNNGWKNLNTGIATSGALAVTSMNGVKYIYTVNGGQVYEAASNNGWKSLNSGIPTSGPLAVTSMNGVKYVYTVNGGQVHEAASNNGWKNLNSLVPTSGPLAVTSMNGVKYVYTVNGGQVHEAASNNGWKNLSSGVPAPGPVAALSLEP